MSIQYDRMVKVQVAGLAFEDVRIDGEVESTADSQQTTGELTLYNLKKESWSQIEKGQTIIVEAGYRQAGGLSTLYRGKVQRVWNTRGDTSFQTKIQLGDSLNDKATRGGTTEHTFEGVQSTREIAKSLVSDMGLQVGPLDAIPINDTRENFRASGRTKDAMEELVRGTEGLDWMTDIVGVVRFTQGAAAQVDGVRITVSPTSGLVGIPDQEEDRRTSITTLLNPRIRTGGQIVVEGSQFIDATPLTIVGVSHVFSNWTGKFLTSVDAVPLDYESEEE